MNSILRYRFLLALLVLCASCKKETAASASVANEVPETQPAIQTAMSVSITSNLGGFYQAIPARYDSTNNKYPLLIFLHGIEELGNGTTDLPKVLANAAPRFLDQKTFPSQFTVQGKSYSFIILSPQFRQWPEPTDVNALIDYAIAHYRIDTTRIYVSGLSMGGGSTWDYAMAYPNRVAAVVPVSGASWSTQAQLGNMAKANLPVWAFHNLDDRIVGVDATSRMVDFFNSFHPAIAAQETLWPTGGHDAWTRATNPSTKECNGMNIYEWMLQYNRSATN